MTDSRQRPAVDILIVTALCALATLTRLPHIWSEVWGDEAWYFHLAQTWGADRDWIDGGDNTGSQIAYRPAFFVLFWPIAQLGLIPARAVNVAVSLGLVVATYWVARLAGTRRSIATSAAVLVALNSMTSRFGVILFADTLATLFAVLAWASAFKRRYLLATAAMTLGVLCKEALVAVAAALLAAVWAEQRFQRGGSAPAPSVGTRTLAMLATPLLAVATTQAVGRIVFHGIMPGWSSNPTTPRFFSEFMVGGLLVLTCVILGTSRRFLALLPAAAMPLFYVAWGFGLHRGVEGWYGVSILPLALVGHATALEVFTQLAERRFTSGWMRFTVLTTPIFLPPRSAVEHVAPAYVLAMGDADR